MNWDIRLLTLAAHVATWSKDPSTQCGCIIADDRHRIAAEGFNGMPQGVADTAERLRDRTTKLRLILHAEDNAILNATRPLEGCTAYVWPMPPCAQCAGRLIQVGVKRIVAPEPSPALLERWGPDLRLADEMYAETSMQLDYARIPAPALGALHQLLQSLRAAAHNTPEPRTSDPLCTL